jgi:hypothetical protein
MIPAAAAALAVGRHCHRCCRHPCRLLLLPLQPLPLLLLLLRAAAAVVLLVFGCGFGSRDLVQMGS